VERVYVDSKIYKQFVDLFVKEFQSYKVVDPMERHPKMVGALTLPKQPAFLENQIKDAVSKGAKVLTGGNRITNRPGNWFEPTVLVNVNHTMGTCLEFVVVVVVVAVLEG
jgi:acyl-CoA reductase-like NAD-dependent aldehyde dehydrogenase